MHRVQLALTVADVDTAVEFYSNPFGAEPAKRRPGCTNVAIADPPLRLVLIEDTNPTPGKLNHPGVEVDATEAVATVEARLASQGLATVLERQTSCCYAIQDKVWVDDPGGEPWAIHTVLADADMPARRRQSAAPCDAASCASHPEPVTAPSNCRSCC